MRGLGDSATERSQGAATWPRVSVRSALPRVVIVLGALSFVALSLAPARASACTASAGGGASYEVRLSPRAGVLCLMIVTAYEGASCEPAREIGSREVGCNVTRRLAITENGALVSILAPRTSHRDWAILQVTSLRAPPSTRALRLDDLAETASLAGTVRVSFEGASVVFRGRGGEARISLAELATRARASP